MIKKVNNGAICLILLIAAALVLAGCKKKEQPPAPAPQPPKPAAKVVKPVQAQPSSAKLSGAAAESLDFSRKKDPFKPFLPEPVVERKGRPVAAAIRTGNLLPIQSYDVNKFTVSGIIVGLKENTALVIDPAGKGYVVRQGMLIGNNDGRISRITPTAIEVVERYRDDNGRMRTRTIVLTLPRKR